ncbi:MAG: dockerin type I domain-containing protein [Lachnospiraceae bacterium]|nr:dockerin type I domain-containing protein [Lachnospiraceae bacterium]
MKNTFTIPNKLNKFFVGALILTALLFVFIFLPSTAQASQTGYVNAQDLNVRTKPGTNSSVVGTVSYREVTILGFEKDSDGDVWYKISYLGGEYYVYGEYVSINDEDEEEQAVSADAGSFEEQLERFPSSYKSYIRKIHESYPNYIFEANYVDISYDDAVYEETLGHRKLVNMYSDGISWRSLSPDCYNSKTGQWYTFSGDWTDAGIDVIEYYMDPRNFLSVKNMYIFAQQTYSGAETKSGVQTIVDGSFLAGNYTDSTGTHNYIDTIMQVAAESKVSPYVIAATLRQEQPTWGDSPLIDGSKKYYNFFNFGASGSDVVGNGIAYAKSQGWDTVYKSILGGAKSYYNGYLKSGQDTYFYKDYNVINLNFDHQYAQGAYDQVGNAAFLRNAISADHQAVVTLRIPVYTSIPETPQGYPEENSKLNPRYNKDGSVIARKSTTIDTPKSDPTPTDPTPTNNETPEEPKTKAKTYEKGDANGDGKISALDYVAVKNHIMGNKKISDSSKLAAADANGDGKISALDYVRIKNIIMGR